MTCAHVLYCIMNTVAGPTFILEPPSIIDTKLLSPDNFTIPSSWIRKCFALILLQEKYIHIHNDVQSINPHINSNEPMVNTIIGLKESQFGHELNTGLAHSLHCTLSSLTCEHSPGYAGTAVPAPHLSGSLQWHSPWSHSWMAALNAWCLHMNLGHTNTCKVIKGFYLYVLTMLHGNTISFMLSPWQLSMELANVCGQTGLALELPVPWQIKSLSADSDMPEDCISTAYATSVTSAQWSP